MIKFYLDKETFIDKYLRSDGVMSSDKTRLEPTDLAIYENVLYFEHCLDHLIIVRLSEFIETIEPHKIYNFGIRTESKDKETHIILDTQLNDEKSIYGFIFYSGRKAYKVLEKEAVFEKQWTGKTWGDEMYFIKIGLYKKAKIKYYVRKKYKFLEFDGEWKEYDPEDITKNTQSMLNMYGRTVYHID